MACEWAKGSSSFSEVEGVGGGTRGARSRLALCGFSLSLSPERFGGGEVRRRKRGATLGVRRPRAAAAAAAAGRPFCVALGPPARAFSGAGRRRCRVRRIAPVKTACPPGAF